MNIKEKIQQWISCQESETAHTIFPLWRPLRFTLARINGYPKLNKIGNLDDEISFLNALSKYDLESFLPTNKTVVIKLARLFELGMTEANFMSLPDIKGRESLNELRNQAPFYGYMPYFLYECFDGGNFAQYFEHEAAFVEWIKEQHLEMFFEEEGISRDTIKDLSGMMDYRKSIPLDMELMLDNYIAILEKRKALL